MCGKPPGGLQRPDSVAQGFAHLRQDPRASLLQGLRILPRSLGQVTRPAVHQDTPAVEQVRARMGCLDPVPDHSARAASITSRGWSVFSHSGILVTVRFPQTRG